MCLVTNFVMSLELIVYFSTAFVVNTETVDVLKMVVQVLSQYVRTYMNIMCVRGVSTVIAV